ncbi:MAG: DUF3784 domain-containing protein [Mucilaginibacter sp.]
MHNVTVLAGAIEASVALLIMFLAYLIKYKKKVNIIAGYDETTVKDKNGLANWVGGTLLISGCLTFMFSLLSIFLPELFKISMIFYFLVISAGGIIAAVGGRKYKN